MPQVCLSFMLLIHVLYWPALVSGGRACLVDKVRVRGLGFRVQEHKQPSSTNSEVLRHINLEEPSYRVHLDDVKAVKVTVSPGEFAIPLYIRAHHPTLNRDGGEGVQLPHIWDYINYDIIKRVKVLDNDVCQRMWDADNHRFVYGTDYTLRLQGKTNRRIGDRDLAQQPLFLNVNEEKLLAIPTFKNLIELLANYKLKTGQTEIRSPGRIQEEIKFIDSVLNTPPMKIAQQYLQGKSPDKISNEEFKEDLLEMWFNLYQRGRGGAYGESSGFEHVFVGELTKKPKQNWKVGGLHNWVAFYLQEKASQADYLGYYTVLPAQIENLNRGQGYQNKEPVNAVVKFTWHDSLKPKGGFFIGTSPEFELALYTLCFKIHPGKLCTCRIGRQTVKIKTYEKRRTPYVATAFPMV